MRDALGETAVASIDRHRAHESEVAEAAEAWPHTRTTPQGAAAAVDDDRVAGRSRTRRCKKRGEDLGVAADPVPYAERTTARRVARSGGGLDRGDLRSTRSPRTPVLVWGVQTVGGGAPRRRRRATSRGEGARDSGLARKGDLVAIVSGVSRQAGGATDTVRIVRGLSSPAPGSPGASALEAARRGLRDDSRPRPRGFATVSFLDHRNGVRTTATRPQCNRYPASTPRTPVTNSRCVHRCARPDRRALREPRHRSTTVAAQARRADRAEHARKRVRLVVGVQIVGRIEERKDVREAVDVQARSALPGGGPCDDCGRIARRSPAPRRSLYHPREVAGCNPAPRARADRRSSRRHPSV